ncbi:MAG: hypothetical protein WCX65_04270 [bacterium]
MKKVLESAFIAFILMMSMSAAVAAAEAGFPLTAACASGEWKCTGDAYTLSQCENGEWKNTECMRDSGKLCENNACVDPWRYGSPEWPAPAQNKLDTPESLSNKAAYYEDISKRLHVSPKLKYMTTVYMPCKSVECAPGQTPPCKDCMETAIPEEIATWNDVERFGHHDNDGLFSALYLAAEAFRYGVTRDPQALEMIKLLLDGEVLRMRITGVPGLFTRSYSPPDFKASECPAEPKAYIHDLIEGNNQKVLIGDDGCARIYDGKKKEWQTTTHCVSKEFAGWCWTDNVSKDEYAGHMFALGAVAKLVDDPQAQAIAKDLIAQVAEHLIKNKMEVVDWDGRVTSYGRFHAATFGDYTGLNAAMGLDFIKIAAEVTKDHSIARWYDDCLLQKSGKRRCLNNILETPMPYTNHLVYNGIYVDADGCQMNYDNNAMHVLSMHNLIWFEHDPKLREIYQKSFDEDVFRKKGHPRALINQNNVFFDFVFASQKRLGPGSDGPALDAVSNGVAMLRQFPTRYHYENTQPPPEKSKPFCKSRHGEDLGEFARTPGERCPNNVSFWEDPYRLYSCSHNSRVIVAPTDFLLPYWMGRYYGFISEKE